VKTGLFAGDLVVSQRAPQLYAQSLKSKPASEHSEVKSTVVGRSPVSQIPPELIWGLVPAVGIIGGGAFWLGRRSNQAMTSTVDFVELEDDVRDLPASKLPALEEASQEERVTASRDIKCKIIK
jgi:membrane fusion protein, heavy metal efflux system